MQNHVVDNLDYLANVDNAAVGNNNLPLNVVAPLIRPPPWTFAQEQSLIDVVNRYQAIDVVKTKFEAIKNDPDFEDVIYGL
ncbi:hypothetical protein A2U01_0023381 [Trifolium medium]|uniref:Uncharacterized protein n=1 Tax=Trifolium medium TaxID=97028 RepID=A0A392NT69_9FABA|nr:hypothetical protein [Trifolium medium]